jgi:hypothetical protein
MWNKEHVIHVEEKRNVRCLKKEEDHLENMGLDGRII